MYKCKNVKKYKVCSSNLDFVFAEILNYTKTLNIIFKF